MIATGVRWDESNQRSTRGGMEVVGSKKKNAIILSDEDIAGKNADFTQLSMFSDEIMLMNDNGKKRKFMEKCELKAKTICNPIIEWKHADIWEFIKSERLDVNELYFCGFGRVGCIGCPMAGKYREFEFQMFKTYKISYIHAFDRMLARFKLEQQNTTRTWKTGQDVFDWWMEDKNITGQMSIEDFIN